MKTIVNDDEYEYANAICLECGTNLENKLSGFCKFGHDNWLEEVDNIERFELAVTKFKLNISEIKKLIKKQTTMKTILILLTTIFFLQCKKEEIKHFPNTAKIAYKCDITNDSTDYTIQYGYDDVILTKNCLDMFSDTLNVPLGEHTFFIKVFTQKAKYFRLNINQYHEKTGKMNWSVYKSNSCKLINQNVYNKINIYSTNI